MPAFRIATFNLENLDDRATHGPSLDERIATLRPQLLRLDADVLALQEVNAQSAGRRRRTFRALDRLLDGTPYADYARSATTNAAGDKPRDIQNLVTLSRRPILSEKQYLNDLVPQAQYRPVTAEPTAEEPRQVSWERPVLHTVIALDGGLPLHVINLHLRAPLPAHIPGQKIEPFVWKSTAGWAEGTFIAEIQRVGQALETRLLIESIFDGEPQARIVVLGDLNAGGDSTPMKILRGEVEETGNAALAPRVLTPLEFSLPADRRFSVMHYGHPLMLDHLMVSRAMLAAFRRTDIHNELLTDELLAFFAGRPDADSFHAPVVAEFAFPS